MGDDTRRSFAEVRPADGTRRRNLRFIVEQPDARLDCTRSVDRDKLYRLAARRVLLQAANVRTGGGDISGRRTLLGVSCQTITAVDRIRASPPMQPKAKSQLRGTRFTGLALALTGGPCDGPKLRLYHNS